jgi:glutathione S-transferase
LFGHCGVELTQWPSLSAYLARIQARPHVKAAIGIEMELRKTVKM